MYTLVDSRDLKYVLVFPVTSVNNLEKKNQNGQQTEVLSVIFIILLCRDRDFLDSRSGGFTPSGRGFSVQQVPLSFKLRDG